MNDASMIFILLVQKVVSQLHLNAFLTHLYTWLPH